MLDSSIRMPLTISQRALISGSGRYLHCLSCSIQLSGLPTAIMKRELVGCQLSGPIGMGGKGQQRDKCAVVNAIWWVLKNRLRKRGSYVLCLDRRGGSVCVG